MDDINPDRIAEGMLQCPLMCMHDTMNGTALEILSSIPGSIRAASYECSKKRLEKDKILQPLKQEIIEALQETSVSLKDWIRTTGYGEVNRRDRAALEKVERVLNHIGRI